MLKEAAVPHRAVHVVELAEQLKIIGKVDARSFPLVFAGDEFIGGFTHIVHLHAQGKLSELVGEPGDEAVAALGTPPAAVVNATAQAMKTDPPSAVMTAKNELAGFAAWGEHRKRTKQP